MQAPRSCPTPPKAKQKLRPTSENQAREETYGFRTAPRPGTRRPFTFGYASDSRGGSGGGERNFLGPNAHMMRRIMALAADRRLAFLQFTGDLVSGSVPTPEMLLTEFANWKRAVEPHGHWLPVYTTIGNHESTMREFAEPGGKLVRLPRFPFATESTEATFARALVNPTNGPASEDGAAYDPDPSSADFPPYRENVYSYVHDNVAVVVLNARLLVVAHHPADAAGGRQPARLPDGPAGGVAGGAARRVREEPGDRPRLPHAPHARLPQRRPRRRRHVVRGEERAAAWVAGKAVAKGIIERRDDLLRLVQSHPKVLAFLTGDEHNYNRTRLAPGVEIYPAGWTGPKVNLRRVFYQVNNGAAGAPSYAQDRTPWSPAVKGFSTQNALCLFHVEGPHVRLEVINPETLEVIDRAVLR